MPERRRQAGRGVAVIHVGAATESEMKEKKARVEDALQRDRGRGRTASWPGGGRVALIRCLPASRGRQGCQRRRTDWRGHHQARRESPLRPLPPPNAGVEGSLIVQEVKKRKGNEGLLMSPRAIRRPRPRPAWWTRRRSPVRRCRSAAFHTAGLLLTTECLITTRRRRIKPAPGGGMAARHGRRWAAAMDY